MRVRDWQDEAERLLDTNLNELVAEDGTDRGFQ